MPKPLLTDDIIEKAAQERERLENNLRYELENDREISKKYDEIERKLSKNSVYKSRRIENARQKERSSLVNKWLLIVILIVLVLGVSFFLYYF
jgi:Fe2+ transport system protein B